MIDVHCHMLPGMDDGSKSVEMSLEMIRRSRDQGVRGIIFTPHFYADMNSPGTFLKRRAESLARLEEQLPSLGEVPEYTTGAEVHYFRGMSRVESLESLCIGRSNYILIEMPFRTWQPYMLEEIEEISKVSGLNVIIAHLERYLDQDKRLVKRLIDDPDILVQCNAEFFLERRTASKASKMLRKGQIDLLASDSHNLESRRPNLAEAFDIIEQIDRKGALDHILRCSDMVFASAL